MFNNFLEYLNQKLNEAEDPQVGDTVYFGIHDLHRNDFTLDSDNSQDKMGEIVDIDPINEKIKVRVKKDPFHLGYRKLEDSKTRSRRKKMSKDEEAEVTLPSTSLKDVTRLAPDGSKTWLVVDRNTNHQNKINKKINKFMHKNDGSEQTSKEPPADEPTNQDDMQGLPASNIIQFPGNKPVQYFQINREIVPVPFESDYWNRTGWKMENKINSKTYRYY